MRMKTVLPAVLALLSAACAVPRDTSRVPWYPHKPTAWRATPGGHTRDAGPFQSVQMGFLTEEEIDAGVDAGFANFQKVFPDLPCANKPVALNDDYAMFVPQVNAWASGVDLTGAATITVCLWTRANGPADPGKGIFIVRPPGTYWDVPYPDWRWTVRPIAPAIMHELLHEAIGDPNHTDPRWKLVQ